MVDEPVQIHISVDRKLHTRTLHAMPWGMRSELFRTILNLIVSLIEEHGPIIIGAILAGQVKLAWDEEKGRKKI